MADRIGDAGCITLPDGRDIHLTYPDPSMITPAAVARGLACQFRWGGFGRKRITVAEHCIRAAQACLYRIRPEAAMQALLHDAHEAFVRDLPPAMKRLLRGYQDLADRWQLAIEQALGRPHDERYDDIIDEIDMALRHKEVRDGFAPPCDLGPAPDMTYLPMLVGLDPDGAESEFGRIFESLKKP